MFFTWCGSLLVEILESSVLWQGFRPDITCIGWEKIFLTGAAPASAVHVKPGPWKCRGPPLGLLELEPLWNVSPKHHRATEWNGCKNRFILVIQDYFTRWVGNFSPTWQAGSNSGWSGGLRVGVLLRSTTDAASWPGTEKHTFQTTIWWPWRKIQWHSAEDHKSCILQCLKLFV